jgi:two-component system response regulator
VIRRDAEILLVEDNPGDVRLTREALAESGRAGRLHVVGDGEEALRFLRRQPPFTDAPRPDLILLDLNLPRVDGRQVLAELGDDDGLRHIPVVVLTTSARDEDVAACRASARAFITKPADLDSYIDVVRWIDDLARARGRVLVVDDDRGNRRLLELQLTEHGLEVATADGGNAAIDGVATFAPDVILLDVHMPGPDGLETCRRLKAGEASAPIPVLFVTGRDADPALAEQARDAGGVAILSRDAPVTSLVARVREQITLYRSLGYRR